MNTAKIYHDSDGKERTIFQMIKYEPDWAANRMQYQEKRIKELEEVIEDLREKLDIHPHGL